MGGIGNFLFGSKPKQSSTSSGQSGNYAYPYILGAYGPSMGYTSAAGNMMGNLLGLNTGSSAPAPAPTPVPTTGGTNTNRLPLLERKKGANATTPTSPAPVTPANPYTPVGDGTNNQNSALENWANSGGMKFIMDQGVKALEGSQAGKGIYQSGDTAKELLKYGQGLGSTYLNQYMNQLLEHAKLGIQAGGLVGSTGGWSKNTGESSGSGGKQGALPSMVSAVASIPGISDVRLKTDVVYVGTNADGVRLYDYNFVDHPELPKGRQRGPMAHEVREVLPKAFIPNLWGKYHGVDYAQVKGL